MKRMDRMMAIMMALQQRAETAQSLADKLEVSKRTVLRDMQALSEMGVPLYAVSGPGGGYRLMEGYRLAPLQLTSDEALTLLMALDGMAKYSDGPFRQARWTAADKIRSALPEGTLGEVTTWLAHIGLEVPDRRSRTPHLDALFRHAAEGNWVRAVYRSQRYRRELHLRPIRVYAAYGFWYCVAESPLHGEQRTFRVDRFEAVGRAEPPEGAVMKGAAGAPEIPAAVASADGGPDSCGLYASAAAGLPPDSAPIPVAARLTYRGALLAEQDPDIGHLVKQTGDEVWELAFACPATEWDWAISFFYGMGLDVEVLEPPALRTALRERAQAVAARYV
ncbi:WYL domain-containing protein [Paenibacillus sp. alder61]|uniref:WYL domain-containing protein n=1 Tax=Paenibacillus faecis TaxID=862114 RepID=A0A5D0CYS2_9BACL|nr:MULTISPECIES: WYL domain-containing protein [Paenibacillus]MCA1291605.1 WYL domain-containing protein [Paenibacillus sp. alder61]TYA14848.1 WYL domain-containing protein [Paenibacillus faecis]